MQQLDGLVPPALVYVEQAELQHGVGHQVVVELDLLFTGHRHRKQAGHMTVVEFDPRVELLCCLRV